MLGAVGRLMSAVSCGTTFTPLALFAAGEQGVWYDPSDMTTLFQDSAGTTPVTAVEQPVGKILDKSGRGNHATQSTSASRPVLSARVNLLTKTEQFNDAVWVKDGATITADFSTAPDGTSTAERMTTVSTVNTLKRIRWEGSVTSGTYTTTLHVKDNGGAARSILLTLGNTTDTNAASLIYNFDTDTITASAGGSGFTIVSTSRTILSNGWVRISSVVSVASTQTLRISIQAIYANALAGDFLIWGADLRVSNDGVGLPAYQRVNTSTDYDTSGFPMYLKFDGTDDSLATGSIDFSATDKMTIWAGQRKLATTGMILAELSANAGSNAGAFYLVAGTDAGVISNSDGYTSLARGTTAVNTTQIAQILVASPDTAVLSTTHDIPGDLSTIRRNAVAGTSGTGDKGSGNFGNYPLYIGSRAGSSSRFNGRIYSLIVRGASSTATQISSTETWVNGKTMAY